MEPQDNKQLTLQKAISAHEQAAAALTDLMSNAPGARYAAMLARLEENLADLRANATATQPGDLV
jgi:hypothetical protein